MSKLAESYVQRTAEGGWRIAGSRVSLESVICAYLEGKSPQEVAEEYPTLTAEQVHGAIEFYLCNREAIDQYMRAQAENWRAMATTSGFRHGALLDRLRKSRAVRE